MGLPEQLAAPRIAVTSAWEQHGQTIVAAIVLALMGWTANTTYGTKLEITAMRANLDATLAEQRTAIARLLAETAIHDTQLQQQETRITVIERGQAERTAREIAESAVRRGRPGG